MKNLIGMVIGMAIMAVLPSVADARDCSESAIAEAAMAGDQHYVECCNNPKKAGCNEAVAEPKPEKVETKQPPRQKRRKESATPVPTTPPVVTQPVVLTPPIAVTAPVSPDLEQRIKRLEDEVGISNKDSGPVTKWDIVWILLLGLLGYGLIFQAGPKLLNLRERRARTLGALEELLRNLATELANRQMVDPNVDIQSLEDLINHLKNRQIFDPSEEEE